MESYILREGVLNDDTLFVSDKGKVFKGGYKAIIKEYIYSTSWSNKETIKRFKSEKTMLKYIEKNYPEFEFYY